MPRAIAIVVALVISGVLLFAATRPDTFRVQRTASIKASPEKIFPLINDLHRFNTWNPYEKKDPNIKGSYSGAASGRGAAYAFAGNRDVGKGSIEIIDSASPRRVSMRLHMIEPIEASNDIEFTLEPKGEATQVTWAMVGNVPYPAKILQLFVSMDRMVGQDFAAGLANLKAVAEE
jgi:hypothetical protein